MWYTDAQLWREAEGDFDEQTTDDWDVDYSVYFEENGGDMVSSLDYFFVLFFIINFMDHSRMPETPLKCARVQ